MFCGKEKILSLCRFERRKTFMQYKVDLEIAQAINNA